MSIAFVLGNGTSRQNVSIQAMALRGKIYGCNAIYREYTPDVLVSTDRPIAEHIQHSGYSAKHQFYTRRPLPGLGAKEVPRAYFGYSSGPIATALAAIHGHRHIYLVGFDMAPSADNTINNIYAGTEFYKPLNAPPTFTGNWTKQLVQIMQDHRQTRFHRIVGPSTGTVPQFATVPNLQHVDLSTFLDQINNKKDL